MPATVDTLTPNKRVLMIVSNPAVSGQTGWPIGFWWAEVTHPYWEFVEHGYEVTVASPDGGPVEADGFSDPEHESGYSAHDIVSLGFKKSPVHSALLQNTPRLRDVDLSTYDAIFLAGGQGPMYTFRGNADVYTAFAHFFDAGKPAAAVCHATTILVDARTADGSLIVRGRTWTGFANAEERYADEFVGQKIQPYWIEDQARAMNDTNFITNGVFKPFAVRDGNLITGQQQYSGAAAARLVVEALGI